MPTADSNASWDPHVGAEGLQPQPGLALHEAIANQWQPIGNSRHAGVGNTPFENVYTGNVQPLSQAPGSAGPWSEDIFETLEAYPAVQAEHGIVDLFTPFACFECFAAFRNNTELFKHGKDTGHRPYACYCGKTFSRLYTVTRHLGSRAAASGTSSVGAKHSCPFCTKYDGDKGFNRRDHLLQHLRVLHKIDEKGIAFVNGRAGRTALTPAEAVNNVADAAA
ncbi:hypothetical protein F4801DRAFT_596050 [Xylaria longipes]|nr:hypothetical protein F4801DRAFT_596050 [Xylaria longipes]